jgi:hypothetical protein
VDDLRRCYSAWMRVPEYADPIRVRWYRVPRGTSGDSPLSLYVSSNYDDLKDFDPPLGEQSSTRNPFKDWADCSPPPWKMPGCKLCLGGSCDTYSVSTDSIPEPDPPVILSWASLCRWGPTLWVVNATTSYYLQLQQLNQSPSSNQLVLFVRWTYVVGGIVHEGVAQLPRTDTNGCTGPLSFLPLEPAPFPPVEFTLTCADTPGEALLTESGSTILSEGGWSLFTES